MLYVNQKSYEHGSKCSKLLASAAKQKDPGNNYSFKKANLDKMCQTKNSNEIFFFFVANVYTVFP